ncbi:MAG: Tfp pilus assembly protein FimT/FimU [Bacteriovoracia bacterium]
MKAKNRSAGFTLIEILIVMGLVALVTSVFIPTLNNVFRTSADGFARQTALLLREARDRALLTNKLIRLRVDLDKQELWLEEANANYMLPKVSERLSDRKSDEEKAKAEGDTFRLIKELTKEKRQVPKGIRITEIVSPRQKDPIKEGLTDVYFFSNGSADGVSIHFVSEEKTGQVITLHPVTGQSKIATEGVSQ